MSVCWVLLHLVACNGACPTPTPGPFVGNAVSRSAGKDRRVYVNRSGASLIGEVTEAERSTYGEAKALLGIGSRGAIAVRETPIDVIRAPCVEAAKSQTD